MRRDVTRRLARLKDREESGTPWFMASLTVGLLGAFQVLEPRLLGCADAFPWPMSLWVVRETLVAVAIALLSWGLVAGVPALLRRAGKRMLSVV